MKKRERCPKCSTFLKNAPGIGPFCPNRACDVADAIDGQCVFQAAVAEEEIQRLLRPMAELPKGPPVLVAYRSAPDGALAIREAFWLETAQGWRLQTHNFVLDPESCFGWLSLVEFAARVAAVEAEKGWQPIETAPKDGTPVELYMPKYSCSVKAVWQKPSDLFVGRWMHESGWTPATGEEYATKGLYSHWRHQREDAPAGYIHRKWDAVQDCYVYGKEAEAFAATQDSKGAQHG